MKANGIVRQLDSLGRVVLPIELRRAFELNTKDSLEIYVDGSSIILKKYLPCCIFCGGHADLLTYRGKLVCCNCFSELETFSSQQ